ncbi:E3 binding domain-containing protein [Shigella flexneri]
MRRLLAEHNLDASAIKGSGVGGRLTREDVEKHLAKAPAKEPHRLRLRPRRTGAGGSLREACTDDASA